MRLASIIVALTATCVGVAACGGSSGMSSEEKTAYDEAFAFTAAIRVQSGDLYSAPQKTQNINTCQGMPDAAEASNMELYAGAPVPFRGKLRDAWERGCADGATGEGHSSASKAAAPAPATSSATSVQAAPRLTDQRSQLCIVGWNDYVAQSPVEGLAVAGAAGATVYPVDNPLGRVRSSSGRMKVIRKPSLRPGLLCPGLIRLSAGLSVRPPARAMAPIGFGRPCD
jgi:hypothetical protein